MKSATKRKRLVSENESIFQRNIRVNKEANSGYLMKMSKLIPGEFYWIVIERWIKDYCQKTWTQLRYLGECGKDNCLLIFRRELRDYQNELIAYNITFQKLDYINNHIQILDEKEYNKTHSQEVWDEIDRLLKEQNIYI